MLSRTRRENVVFRHPFRLQGWVEEQPAGAYTVETEEALIEGLSFVAYRRVATTITRRATRSGTLMQMIPVEPDILAAALAADAAPAPARDGITHDRNGNR
ncbi:hypothetical protein [Plastoroseomonas hellenica]|uniref:Uncharacterized protein n=1 Tax=Plastoroseomonas hellenica TaxID=2687306 RepID=A0ABS5F0L4_9PROT|nr:hypothetical protein [Plastoroseomonas hellenica]MBR0645641.1 hypothetical protein [Plastoroseomonas hellenica]MBR0666069.1 hypothetical protein [Plastoroseomonas hellenica]